MLAVKRQLADGRWLLAKVPVTAENDKLPTRLSLALWNSDLWNIGLQSCCKPEGLLKDHLKWT